MTSFGVQLLLLLAFSAGLAVVVSAYREEEPGKILRGSLRRGALFALAVLAIGGVAVALGGTLLHP